MSVENPVDPICHAVDVVSEVLIDQNYNREAARLDEICGRYEEGKSTALRMAVELAAASAAGTDGYAELIDRANRL